MHSMEDGTDYIGGTLHSTGGNMNSVGGNAAHTEEDALSEKTSTDVRTYAHTYSECHVFDAQFLHSRTVQLPQHAHDTGLLASTRGAVHK